MANIEITGLSFKLNVSSMADILLKGDINAQSEFLNRFFSSLSFDNILQLSERLSWQDRAYHGIKNLNEHITQERFNVMKKRKEMERLSSIDPYEMYGTSDGKPNR